MNGYDFIEKIRRQGKTRGVPVRFEAGHGKGSHGRLYYGERFTTVKGRPLRHERIEDQSALHVQLVLHIFGKQNGTKRYRSCSESREG